MSGTVTNLLIAFFCLVANGFYVAAEFAIVKTKPLRIQQLASEDKFGAKLSQYILKYQENYLACCQLGITMASLGLGWVGEPTVAALLEPVLANVLPPDLIHLVAFLIGFVIFSSLHIVAGEQVPKIFAIRNPEVVMLWCAYPLYISYLIAYPLNKVLKATSSGILSGLGVKGSTYEDIYTHEEIKGLVDVSVKHGEMNKEQAQMLYNLFRFDERLVEDVMISSGQCHSLMLNGDNAKNKDTIRETQHSRFPLLDTNNKLVGVIIVKDMIDALLNGADEPWNNLENFARDPMIVPETSKIKDLFDRMRMERSHIAFMIDEYGSFSGLVSMEDLLEELVGEIADETDDVESEFGIVVKDGKWIAHGLAPLVDVERVIGYESNEDSSANTLSGLIMNKLGQLPQIDDYIEDSGFKFTVEEIKDYRVEKILIEKV
jgi:CBS domain containing-hemolysin-like protein